METSNTNHATQNSHTFPVTERVWGLKTIFSNIYFVANPDGTWVLVDTGVKGFSKQIRDAADSLFGEESRPESILLTHGHFDHTGNVRELAEYWQVPVFAHPMEFPYLTGMSSYPPPDATVGGGAMAYLSFIYPKKPINIQQLLEALPADGSIPGLAGWYWIYTPGHSPGHVSFFREEDGTLLVGDAFVTRDAESAIAVMTEKREVHGPPNYYTPDWISAHRSVDKLLQLNPRVAASGHGMPMKGDKLHWQLEDLVKDFWIKAVPKKGRYVYEPAITDEQGVVSLPSQGDNRLSKIIAITGAVTVAGIIWASLKYRKNSKTENRELYKRSALRNRPFSHNRVMAGVPPTIDPDHDDPEVHTNNYP